MVLALGGLVRSHLGQILHGAVKLGAELAEYLHLSVTETTRSLIFLQTEDNGDLHLHKIIVQRLVWDSDSLVEGAPDKGVLLRPPLAGFPSFLVSADEKMGPDLRLG